MGWPAGLPLRTCSLGPDFGIASGSDYGVDITVTASRPLMTWAATGAGALGDSETISIEPGAAQTLQLPVTDATGWLVGGVPVDVSGGQQSHLYNITIKPWQYDSAGRKKNIGSAVTLNNVAIPAGDGSTLDLDKSASMPGATGGTVTIPDYVAQLQTAGGLRLADVAPTATASGALVPMRHNPVDATSGSRIMTLADATDAGQLVVVSKKDASANTVTVSVAHLRDGGAGSITLVGQYEAITLTSKADGSWWPIGDHKTKAYFDATYAGVYVIDRSHASTDAAPVDATAYIQSVLDAAAADPAPRKTVIIPAGTFFYTFLEVGESTVLTGLGSASVLKQMPGITYASATTGVATGSYGLSCKTNLRYVGFHNFRLEGNAAACIDAQTQFESAFAPSGTFTVGNLKCGGLAIDRLNRGTLTDGTWIAPDYVWVDQVWSNDSVRSNFLFQMGTNRTSPGVADVGTIYARDSAIDHLLYAAESESIQVTKFVGEGHWREGAMAISGAKFAGGSAFFRNLTQNPWNNTTHGYDFDSMYCIDDRPDVKGSTFNAISLVGDLAVLGGPDSDRALIHSRGFGSTLTNVQIEHTGTSLDLMFAIMVAEQGSSGGGTIEAPSMTGVKARGMPSKTRIFAFDPNAWGASLIGGSVSNVYMTTAIGAATQPTLSLFEFKGLNANGFTARDIYVENENYVTAGPTAIYQNACTGAFADMEFTGVVIRRAGSGQPWIDATSVASNVTIAHCHVYSTGAPTRAMEDVVERILNSTLGATKYVDSTIIDVAKTADQSITSSTTLTNDSQLSTWFRKNATYLVEAFLIVDAGATGALKTHIYGPSGATVNEPSVAPAASFTTGNSVQIVRSARVATGSTAGFGGLQFAQNTSDATATVMKTGSFLRIRRIS